MMMDLDSAIEHLKVAIEIHDEHLSNDAVPSDKSQKDLMKHMELALGILQEHEGTMGPYRGNNTVKHGR